MIRKLALYFAAVILGIATYACNEEVEAITQTATCAAVKSFSFTEDDSVMENLDSVYFSIDLNKGLIYNADSLPYGTNITKLVPVILTFDGASVAELSVRRAGMSDTIYNYSTNSTDSIDFTNPVKLRLVSLDGRTERNYTIKVNVHTLKADSLTWAQVDRRTIPSLFAYPTAQRTARRGDALHCLTYYSGNYCMASLNAPITDLNSADADLWNWDMQYVTFPIDVNINSFSATTDALYILGTNGRLLRSTDSGASWDFTDQVWNHIYGGFDNYLIGNIKDGTDYMIATYPTNAVFDLPQGMPVSDTSTPAMVSTAMSVNPIFVITGGRKADGTLNAAAWGFDGYAWAKISKIDLPFGLISPILVSYYSFTTEKGIHVNQYPTLFVIGGRKADGKNSDVVYTSNDNGYTWSTAGESMQLPDYVPALYNAQAFTIVSTMTSDLSTQIAKPTESWQCPYIYIFGGINDSGTTSNNVWRGVINRLTFKPVE